MNHRFFSTKNEFVLWLSSSKVEIVDYVELYEGIFIDYIPLKDNKEPVSKRRKRLYNKNNHMLFL